LFVHLEFLVSRNGDPDCRLAVHGKAEQPTFEQPLHLSRYFVPALRPASHPRARSANGTQAFRRMQQPANGM
jgi:hypothetical protein